MAKSAKSKPAPVSLLTLASGWASARATTVWHYWRAGSPLPLCGRPLAPTSAVEDNNHFSDDNCEVCLTQLVRQWRATGEWPAESFPPPAEPKPEAVAAPELTAAPKPALEPEPAPEPVLPGEEFLIQFPAGRSTVIRTLRRLVMAARPEEQPHVRAAVRMVREFRPEPEAARDFDSHLP